MRIRVLISPVGVFRRRVLENILNLPLKEGGRGKPDKLYLLLYKGDPKKPEEARYWEEETRKNAGWILKRTGDVYKEEGKDHEKRDFSSPEELFREVKEILDRHKDDEVFLDITSIPTSEGIVLAKIAELYGAKIIHNRPKKKFEEWEEEWEREREREGLGPRIVPTGRSDLLEGRLNDEKWGPRFRWVLKKLLEGKELRLSELHMVLSEEIREGNQRAEEWGYKTRGRGRIRTLNDTLDLLEREYGLIEGTRIMGELYYKLTGWGEIVARVFL